MTSEGSASSHNSFHPKREAADGARKYVVIMLLTSAALMVAWSLAVPVFEGPDEPDHWKYANFLNQNHAMPIFGPDFREANSPPLYYLLIAPLAVEEKLPPIAYGGEYGHRYSLFPPRVYQNSAGDLGRFWPFRAARLLSVFISVITIWFCYLAGREASGRPEMGLLVGGLVAFWPMFTFRGMNVSNDALVGMLSALANYLIVRMIIRGFNWKTGFLGALAIAGAFLTKSSAIILPVPFLLTLISERVPWRAKVIRAVVLGAIMLVIVAPWLIRNQHLYGDLLAQKAMFTAVSGLIEKHSLLSRYFFTFFPLVLIASFIGNFGWQDLPLPVWAYLAYIGALICAIASWVRGVRNGRIDFRLSAILCSIIALNFLVVVYINLTFAQPNGRYMFPALPAIALLAGLGLESLDSWTNNRALLAVGGLALSNLVILAALVIPAYWPPVIN